MGSKTAHTCGWWTPTQTTMSRGTTPTWVARGHSMITCIPGLGRFKIQIPRRETNFTDGVLNNNHPPGGGHKKKYQGNSNHEENLNRSNTNKSRYGPGGKNTTLANNTCINAASSGLPLPAPYDSTLIHTVAIDA